MSILRVSLFSNGRESEAKAVSKGFGHALYSIRNLDNHFKETNVLSVIARCGLRIEIAVSK